MHRIASFGALAVLVGLTLFSGIVQGRLSNRWGPTPDLKEAAKKFDRLPRQFGNWRLVQESDLSDRVADMLQCPPPKGYLSGLWVNDVTGEKVTAFIVLGPPGPISVHTPDICYSSKDYEIVEERAPVQIQTPEGKSHEFWALTLKRKDVHEEHLRAYYAWGNKDAWHAPNSPRFAFGGDGLLYKIQLAADVPGVTPLEDGDTCQRFLQGFIPAVTPTLLQ
jgi:hypothetical protein